jgi:hypothetical protein
MLEDEDDLKLQKKYINFLKKQASLRYFQEKRFNPFNSDELVENKNIAVEVFGENKDDYKTALTPEQFEESPVAKTFQTGTPLSDEVNDELKENVDQENEDKRNEENRKDLKR